MAPINSPHSLASRVKSLATMGKPSITIVIGDGDADNQSWITALSSLDAVNGKALIVAGSDTRFDDIEISLRGYTKTFVDRMATVSAANSRQNAYHAFLTLTQPDVAENIPADRVLKAGQTYEIPFNFVVPAHMSVNLCHHQVKSNKVREMHVQLPPSFGDAELAGHGNTLLDDMAPDMARVSYCISVRISKRRGEERDSSLLVERTRKLRIIPAAEESPPLNVDADADYSLRSEKTIKKSMLGSKVGRVVAEAAQPQSLSLPPPNKAIDCPVTTTATIMLRWDPIDAAQAAPKLSALTTKLRVSTFYSSAGQKDFPTREGMTYDSTQGVINESLSLSTRCVESVQWERHDGTEQQLVRRNSTIASTAAIPKPSKHYVDGQPFYTAEVLVPISLPKHKCFVPTFYSCLVSRTYTLEFSLGMRARATSSFISSVDLKVPVQIRSSPTVEGEQRRASLASQASQSSGIDEYLNPRSIAPPPAEFLNTAQLRDAPPEYSYFAQPSRVPVCG